MSDALENMPPLDMRLLRTLADTYPDMAMEEFNEVLEAWKEAGATVFFGAWDEAYRHYEGALPDEISHRLVALQAAFVMCGLPIVNLIEAPLIRDVDENGVGPLGDEYHFRAAPQLVEKRLAFDIPVLLRYPDRRLVEGNEVRFTETAAKMLEADLKATVLPEDKWRQH